MPVHTASFPIHRITSAQYHQMVESGALEGANVELADGLLIELSPQSGPHARMIQVLQQLFGTRLDLLRVQLPLEAKEGWVPEPDMALAEHTDPARHPTSALLAIEVAVSSHQYDMSKARVFAQAAIPTYWIIDVPGRQVFAYTEPGPDGYARERTLDPTGELDPGVPGIEPFTVEELFATAFSKR